MIESFTPACLSRKRAGLPSVSRFPTDAERRTALESFARLGNQRGAEALQWALLNKLDFLHNY